jgi:hypothetical protein
VLWLPKDPKIKERKFLFSLDWPILSKKSFH